MSKDTIETDDKRLALRVFGLTEGELAALREIACKEYGKPRVSLLAKNTLKARMVALEEPELVRLPPPTGSRRITVRLPEKDRAYLEAAAEKHKSSVNDIIRDIVQSHFRKHPLLTAAEVKVLFQSNYQLLSIGRNLNQIARQLNRGEGASLTSEQIKALSQYIKQHTQRVGDVLRTNRKRLSE